MNWKTNDYLHNPFEYGHAFYNSNSPSGLRPITPKGYANSILSSSIRYVIHKIIEYDPYSPLLQHDVRLHQRTIILTCEVSEKPRFKDSIYKSICDILIKLVFLKNSQMCHVQIEILNLYQCDWLDIQCLYDIWTQSSIYNILTISSN